jgi:hypothetical protein
MLTRMIITKITSVTERTTVWVVPQKLSSTTVAIGAINWGIGNWESVGVGRSSKDTAFNKGLGNADEHTPDEDAVQE